MKAVFALILTVSSLSFAASEPVFQCIDGTRYFKIYKQQDGSLRGYLKEFHFNYVTHESHKVSQYRCTRRTPGIQHFDCRKGDYILEAYRTRGERGRVHLSLDGDFGPFDSGSLYSLSCSR